MLPAHKRTGSISSWFTVLTAVLLSSSMLAATEAPETQRQSSQCRALEESVDACQSGTGLSREARDSCDRDKAAFVALCGSLGTIGASASAAGGALDLLRQDYRVVPIEQAAGGVFPRHFVIGPADLDDPHVIALLKRSYRFGKTVAIAGATEDQASRFHSLLRPGEAANCRPAKFPAKGQAKIAFYGLQRSRYRMPPQHSSYCLVNLDPQDPGADRRWLRGRLALALPQPAAGKVTATRNPRVGQVTTTSSALSAASDDSPTQFLTDLAGATHCSSKFSNSSAAIEEDLYVYSMRNFTDTGCGSCQDVGADYYLVQDNLTYSKYAQDITFFSLFSGFAPLLDTTNNVAFTMGSYNLEFTDPVTTTTYESSYTNSSSVTADASVGLTAEGPTVTGGSSVTTSQSMTYNVPPTKIGNTSDLPIAAPNWSFTPQSLPGGSDFEVNPTWTWFIPRDAYPSGGIGSGEIQFTDMNFAEANTSFVEDDTVCNVPFPFSAWTVNPPQLLSLGSGSTTINGGVFTITGQYLYPNSVVAVLIGGTAVPLDTNVDLVDDTTIDVAVPGGFAPGTYQVQVNTQFNGQDRFSNTLPLTLTN